MDRVLLVGAALLLCVICGSALLFLDIYDLDQTYFIYMGNAIVLAAIIGGHFRKHFKRPWFVLFFAGWMGAHGLIAVALWYYLWFWYWLPVIALELCVGSAVAYVLFGPPTEKTGAN